MRSVKMYKKHDMHISPVPQYMLEFAPLGSIDTKYGQIYKNINDEAYKAAGIDGFLPHNPWKGFTPSITRKPMVARAAAQFVKGEGNNDQTFPEFPTLAEINQDLSGWTEDEVMSALCLDKEEEVPSKPYYALAKSVPLTNSNGSTKINALHSYLLQLLQTQFHHNFIFRPTR